MTTTPAGTEPDAMEPLVDQSALCLSGGGYRAMLFHAGSMWRLNELGVLGGIDRVSSVSGGSIAAATLALAWKRLRFDDDGVAGGFEQAVVRPLRGLASRTLDIAAGIARFTGVHRLFGFDPLLGAYRRHLFGSSTLQDLPDRPRFVINATNLQSTVLWRFSKPYMRDYQVGAIDNPTLELAIAVAASSAFPPVLSPVFLNLQQSQYAPAAPGEDLRTPRYMEHVVLSDGGVYDNLGLQSAERFRTLFVSDGGGHFAARAGVPSNWIGQMLRAMDVTDSQVRKLRRSALIEDFKSGRRQGAYWGIRTPIDRYQLPDTLACPADQTLNLAATPTRLARLEAARQERLINWGYAVTDAAVRAYALPHAPAATRFPYESAGVG